MLARFACPLLIPRTAWLPISVPLVGGTEGEGLGLKV